MDNPKRMKMAPTKKFKKTKPDLRLEVPPALEVRERKASWMLWFYNGNLSHPVLNMEYVKRISPLAEVTTAVDLLPALHRNSIYYLDPFHKFPPGSSFCFFLNEIKPVWEDDGNYNGGRVVTRIKSRTSNAEIIRTKVLFYWWIMLKSLVNDYFEHLTPHICGAKVRYTLSAENKISLWTNDDVTKDPELQEKIILKLKELFEDNPTSFTQAVVDPEFQPHQKRDGFVAHNE